MDQNTPVQTKIDQVIEILKKNGSSDDQIAEVFAQITQAGFQKMYLQAVETFTDEDIKTIENCKTDEETNSEIKRLYKERTGLDADTEMQKFIEIFAQGFLDEYNSQAKS